jgi:L-ascorbate metabolism protein UlaG (beta-lactamase superfamily)
VRFLSADQGVQITPVTAQHGNELHHDFLVDPLKTHLAANNLDAYVGVANGFVVTFTNGLRVYLSGDTGQTADMAVVVRGFYQARSAARRDVAARGKPMNPIKTVSLSCVVSIASTNKGRKEIL